MLFVCEFEVFEDEGAWPAIPFLDGGGATQGTSFDDALRMAAEWLRSVALDYLAKGQEFPECQFGHTPEYGGRVVAVAVEASLEEIPAVTAKEVAGLLGVSTGRVTQLCNAGQLDSWKVGRTRMVSLESVELRLAEERRAGRPRKEAVPV